MDKFYNYCKEGKLEEINKIYKDQGLLVTVDPNFLSSEDAQRIFDIIDRQTMFGSVRRNKEKYRTKVIYGDPDLKYTIQFMNNTVVYKTTPWNKLPILLEIKEKLEKLTDVKYNFCVVQRYPHGGVIIKKHRDKEMTPGTTICGVSLGATRTFRLSRRNKEHDIPLPSGTLYLLQPPTNDYWCHEILTDPTRETRISLTFRNYNAK